MTPTEIPNVVSTPSTAQPWFIIVVIGLVVALFAIGIITGQVRLTPSKTRQAAKRGMLTMDAVLSTPERRAAIEYIRDDEHQIELEQGRGEGNGDDEEENVMLFQWSDKDNDGPD